VKVRLLVHGGVIAAAIAANLHLRAAEFAIALAAGGVAWTLVEYLMHRFAFHGFAPHWEHHAEPTNPDYILAPLPLSLSASAVLWILFSAAAGSWRLGALVLAGVVCGYLAYEFLHIRIHSPAAGSRMLRALRRRHYYHHFASDRACYGVTSPLWDFVFATAGPLRTAETSRQE
jgi:sterol desaturase/sphingolipid hydroxylase (fatty acid hydroxylase superfamily)